MACRPRLIHPNEQRVLITVIQDFLDALNVSRCLAFLPEFLARAAPEPCQPSLHAFPQRLGIHVCHHQHLVVAPILDNCRYQTLVIEFQIFRNSHHDDLYHNPEKMSSGGSGRCPILERSRAVKNRPRKAKPVLKRVLQVRDQIKRLISASAARSIHVAAPPNSTPSMMSDCL